MRTNLWWLPSDALLPGPGLDSPPRPLLPPRPRQVASLAKALAASHEEVAGLRQALHEAQARVEQLQAELATAERGRSSKAAALNRRLAAAQKEVESAQAAAAAAAAARNREVAALREQLAAAEDAVQRLRGAAAEAAAAREGEAAALWGQLARAQQAQEAAAEDAARREEELASVREQLQQAEEARGKVSGVFHICSYHICPLIVPGFRKHAPVSVWPGLGLGLGLAGWLLVRRRGASTRPRMGALPCGGSRTLGPAVPCTGQATLARCPTQLPDSH